MKRFFCLIFCMLLFSLFSVVAFADDTDPVLFADPNPLFGFEFLFDYDPVTEVATSRLTREQITKLPLDVREFLSSFELNPSRYAVLFSVDGNSSYLVLVEFPVESSGVFPSLYMQDNFLLTVVPSGRLNCLSFSSTGSIFHLPTSVGLSSVFNLGKASHSFKASYPTSFTIENVADDFYLDEISVSRFRLFPSVSSVVSVSYLNPDGSTAFPPVTKSFAVGDDYSIVSPSLSGYTPSQPIISGTMPDSDLSFTVVYNPNPYTLTVNYVNSDGVAVHSPHVSQVLFGDKYSVPSPFIYGFESLPSVVSGIMPSNNHSLSVVYNESISAYDRVLYDSLDSFSIAVRSNIFVLIGICLLLLALLVSVWLLIRILKKFSESLR